MVGGTQQRVRAGCYLRISSDPRDRREGVDRQREDTSALCEVKGWEAARYYIDNDRSASNGKDRPEWDRLLADIESGDIDAIAAWDQDRGWRMMSELEELRRFFKSLGRRVQFATTGQGDIDLYSPTGVLAVQIKTAVSEHEIAMMKVRMLRAARHKAEQGKPKWRKAFGYIPETRPKHEDDGRRELDPVTAPLVQQAYAAILAGGSLMDITRDWNAREVYGLNGQPWTAATLSLFLRAPRNAGLRAHNGEIVGPGTWEPLVDEATWRAAQAVMNAPGRAPGRKSVRKHLLTGVMSCGKCVRELDSRLSGRWAMQAHGAGPRAHSIVYACKTCRGCSIRAEHVEPLLYQLISARLARPDAVDLLKAEQHDAAEAEALRLERMTLLARLDEVADERADGLIDGRGYRRATERIQAKLDDIERRQQDGERLRVFDGIPLGKPEVTDAVEKLSADRFRAVLDVLCTITVLPVGKGGKAFKPERVQVDWR
ncbi:recombinase family protein [Mycobacteroides abscessus]|uniref:recombinase family protein n=1 Tax=Mycobacteroides abscessus TaxID=36809 RepID=UPI0002683465|nr:recombinase family protein [Mycobacteroides abscessus]EIT90884.1 recombinase [Mycobacteroides abscessus 4S-0303]EIT92883.1 recombinase [Mycobacteroides abscessus 4S-0726-RB]EIT96428.1 recombinase [Mycobacteroides abscessus 4S-0726-RA]EIV07138.1 recombinase [Mycobacteroides abscessus 4S-0206]EIV47149.1 recombinase [Mycobacteroides abscessus 4S-0116-R]